jgi:hypothetical protein
LSYGVPRPLREGAVSAFGEPLGLDAEGVVKTGAIVLPGDSGGQLDELYFAEAPAKLREELIGDVLDSPTCPSRMRDGLYGIESLTDHRGLRESR